MSIEELKKGFDEYSEEMNKEIEKLNLKIRELSYENKALKEKINKLQVELIKIQIIHNIDKSVLISAKTNDFIQSHFLNESVLTKEEFYKISRNVMDSEIK